MSSYRSKRSSELKFRSVLPLLVLSVLAWRISFVLADVLYLTNGNVMIVEKAWVEGDLVKYQTSTGVMTLPASQVRKIQEQTPTKGPPGPAAHYGIAGFQSEIMSGWDATSSKKASLDSGTTFKQIEALFVAMCKAI